MMCGRFLYRKLYKREKKHDKVSWKIIANEEE